MSRYALAPRAVDARARALALWGATQAAAPALLVLALVSEMQLAPRAWLLPVGVAVAILAALRGLVEHRQARARLGALVVEADDAGLTVSTVRGVTRLTRAAIVRAREIGGPLGGLRLELAPAADLPRRFDVPRGGERFGELREAVERWRPIERARRRGRVARVLLLVAVVAGIFFVPFVLADARTSRYAVAVVLIAAWAAMRLALAR